MSSQRSNKFDVSEDIVRVMLNDQFPRLAGEDISRFESPGTDNNIFRIGEHYCARMPKVAWAAQTARREVSLLPRLDGLPLAVPQPIGVGRPSADYPCNWSVMNWIDGEVVEPLTLNDDDAERLAVFILALRQTPPHLAFVSGEPNNYRGSPLADRQRSLDQAFNQLESEVDVSALRRIWKLALSAGEASAGVWLHGDLHGGNLLCREGALTAVIDWGLAGIGDGACDLQPAWCLFERGARETFRAALDASEGEWLRGAGWALSVAAIYLAYYRGRGVPTEMSRRTLDRLIEAFA